MCIKNISEIWFFHKNVISSMSSCVWKHSHVCVERDHTTTDGSSWDIHIMYEHLYKNSTYNLIIGEQFLFLESVSVVNYVRAEQHSV